MAINFTKNVEQFTTAQRSTRVKNFVEFTSKKQLENAEVLGTVELDFVKSIKGTFNFALHTGKRYMAITLYKASAEKKYSFLVLDLQEQAIAQVDSIKQAKAEILELVAQEAQNTEAEAVEQTTAETATENVEAESAEQEADTGSKTTRKNSRKNSVEK